MPETILIDAQAGTLPEGFCPSGPTALQQLYDQFITSTQWSLSVGIRFYNFGDNEPSPNYRIYPWFKTAGGFPDKWYVYTGSPGGWYSLHPIPAGPNGLRVGWVGTESELITYDGGLNEVISLTTGPFWEIDTEFTGRSPMGPGQIPNANPVKMLSPEENYGEGSHLMTDQEVAAHQHPLRAESTMNNPDGSIKFVTPGTTGPGIMQGLTGDNITPLSVQQNTFITDQQSMPVIHPVRGCYQIKRTIRKYYRGT